MFQDKGFSREQTELFLKKVNFMENREYFFHKRKAMSSNDAPDEKPNSTAADASGSDREAGEEDHFQNRARGPRGERRHIFYQSRGVEKENKAHGGFYDKIGSSCRLENGPG